MRKLRTIRDYAVIISRGVKKEKGAPCKIIAKGSGTGGVTCKFLNEK